MKLLIVDSVVGIISVSPNDSILSALIFPLFTNSEISIVICSISDLL